jgi:hypothetical protein
VTGRPRRYCLRGHDTFAVGRSSSGNCRACTAERVQRGDRPHVPDEQRRRFGYALAPAYLERRAELVAALEVLEPVEVSRRAVGVEPAADREALVDVVGPLEPWLALYGWLATAGGKAAPWAPIDGDEAELWRSPLPRGWLTAAERVEARTATERYRAAKRASAERRAQAVRRAMPEVVVFVDPQVQREYERRRRAFDVGCAEARDRVIRALIEAALCPPAEAP